MKRPFNLSAITADLPTLPDEGETPRESRRSAFPAVPIAKAIETQNRNAIAELKTLEAAIEESKAAGLLIEELDPTVVDPSPYWDRDPRFIEDKSFSDFVEDLRRNGQQSPALVRATPNTPGRFEVCFGHRRLFACRHLGLRFRAIVRDLSEVQMASAAYSENSHREGTSILEQARALARYVDRGIFPTKQALADALNLSRPHVSNLTSYAEIPDVVLQALGDWRKCTFREANNLLKAVRDPTCKIEMLGVAKHLVEETNQLSFHARLNLLLGKTSSSSGDREEFRDQSGQKVAERKRGKHATSIAFSPHVADGFSDFVWAKLPVLVEEFYRHRSRRR